MCDSTKDSFQIFSKDFLNKETFKSGYARSIMEDSENRQKIIEKTYLDRNHTADYEKSLFESPVMRKRMINRKSLIMDDSRRHSCGNFTIKRSSILPSSTKRNDLPVENIYNQNKIETLQWQMKEIEKSRGMYKAVLKQVVTFLEKAHVSLDHLGLRLNRKKSVSRSKSEYFIAQSDNISSDSINWTPNKKEELHPDEIPPEKLSQEAFRLLRTAQSLLNTQEPNLNVPEIKQQQQSSSSSSSSNNNIDDNPTDMEFLAQLAKEFPSPHQSEKYRLSPKLILPPSDNANEIFSNNINKAFNRKLSLQLSDIKRYSNNNKNTFRHINPRNSVTEEENIDEFTSLPPLIIIDPLRNDFPAGKAKKPTPSISSMEDESGFSSLNSFQDIGIPISNSTMEIEEVTAKSILLKSMLHSSSSIMNSTLIEEEKTFGGGGETRRHTLGDFQLWQKPPNPQSSLNGNLEENNSNKTREAKVLWV